MNNIVFLIIDSARYDNFVNPVRKDKAIDEAFYIRSLNHCSIAVIRVRFSNGVKTKIKNIDKLDKTEKRYSYASLPSPSHYVY
jgi:hypothetical protein